MKRMTWGSLLILAGLLAVLSGGMLLQTYLGPAAPAASWPEGERVWVVDPGHGGEDGGAVSVTGVPESQINLAIAKRLDAILGEMEGGGKDGLMFDGEPLDDDTRELLRASLQNQLEMAKRLAKQKYTPKKYRK